MMLTLLYLLLRTLTTAPGHCACSEKGRGGGLLYLTQTEGGGRRAALPSSGEMVPSGPEREHLILDSTEPGWGTDSGDPSPKDGHHLQESPEQHLSHGMMTSVPAPDLLKTTHTGEKVKIKRLGSCNYYSTLLKKPPGASSIVLSSPLSSRRHTFWSKGQGKIFNQPRVMMHFGGSNLGG